MYYSILRPVLTVYSIIRSIEELGHCREHSLGNPAVHIVVQLKMASDDPMRFVYYTVKTDLIPEEFNIPKELNDVLNVSLYSMLYQHTYLDFHTTLKTDEI